MANRHELINKTLTNLFRLSDKSREQYTELLEQFNIRSLDQIQYFDIELLQKFLNKILSKLRTGSKKMGKLYTGKDFDKEVNSLFMKNAMKLAQEKEEEEKEKEAPPPQQEEPSQQEEPPQQEKEEGEGEEEQEAQKIEDIVKDLQVSVLEKVNEVKTFKPGKSEAINFRNALKQLIESSQAAVDKVNAYYQKELGGTQEQ